MKRAGVFLVPFFMAAFLQGGELAGVSLPERVVVGEHKFQLNGMGLRKKAFFKVYVGALYLNEKSHDPAAILGADTPRHMVMHFLRDVGKARLVDAWREGFAANTQGNANLANEIERFLALWTDVNEGDEVVMTYIPGKGTTVVFAGKEVGSIAGKAFADALLSVWLGPKPPSEDFKAGILGR